MLKKHATFLLFILTAIILTACSGENDETVNDDTPNKINIYTTVYPLSYFAERIGGDYVETSSIYPPGSNEHTFEPTQQDMIELAEADLFLYIGLGLEGFVENAKETLANEQVKLVATAENISDESLHTSATHTESEDEQTHEDEEHDHESEEHTDEEAHNHGDIDPHVWLSPVIAKDLALIIKEELVAQMPEQEQTFNENYELLISDLDSLNAEFEKMASEAATKTFFVSHAAFGYIADQYGLEQIAVAGINSQSEPSQNELTEIVDLAKKLDIQYILFEQNVSSNLTSIVQEEVGADTLVLHNLSVLTQEDIDNNSDYLTIMQKNIESLRTALNP